jgi:hypothetical protein
MKNNVYNVFGIVTYKKICLVFVSATILLIVAFFSSCKKKDDRTKYYGAYTGNFICDTNSYNRDVTVIEGINEQDIFLSYTPTPTSTTVNLIANFKKDSFVIQKQKLLQSSTITGNGYFKGDSLIMMFTELNFGTSYYCVYYGKK